MRRMRTGRGQTTIGIVLVLLALGLYGYSVQHSFRSNEVGGVRVRFDDATPLGGKGLRLMMERLNYTVKRADIRLQAMPPDARVWMILDPQTHFSRAEADSLMTWVQNGGTLIFAVPSARSFYNLLDTNTSGINQLCDEVGVQSGYQPPLQNDPNTLLPVLKPLTPASAGAYWSGVKAATGSTGQLQLDSPGNRAAPPGQHKAATETETLEIAGNPVGPTLVERHFGKGHVILMPDALLLTNYGLSRPDNAVLASNLLRYHTPSGGSVYFDERQHGEPDLDNGTVATPQDITRYLRVPAVRATLLQLLGACVLLWVLFGTRLGAAVPIPEEEPVTRASNFARAMGALFHKAGRSEAASAILAGEFRRVVARRVGMAPHDPPEPIAARVAQSADVPQPLVVRLLQLADHIPQERDTALLDAAPRAIERLTTGSPEARSEDELLRNAQEMEDVLRRLGVHR